jgi:hypothetical protein
MGWRRGGLGLGQYEAVFRQNDIDETVLPNLTAEDLKELGVASLGHRRKLLDAIAALRTDAGAKGPSSDSSATSATQIASPEDRAERRQVTVMFSDLVGSTALSGRMDPEDLREVISAYQKCVADTVHRFGGFVAKFMGDGVLIYFGHPQAHEDDAERAVGAGLELVAAVSGRRRPGAPRAPRFDHPFPFGRAQLPPIRRGTSGDDQRSEALTQKPGFRRVLRHGGMLWKNGPITLCRRT